MVFGFNFLESKICFLLIVNLNYKKCSKTNFLMLAKLRETIADKAF